MALKSLANQIASTLLIFFSLLIALSTSISTENKYELILKEARNKGTCFYLADDLAKSCSVYYASPKCFR